MGADGLDGAGDGAADGVWTKTAKTQSYRPAAFLSWSPWMVQPSMRPQYAAAVMNERGVNAAIQIGHDRSLQLDSTFGCNAQKFPLYTLLAVDSHRKGTMRQRMQPC